MSDLDLNEAREYAVKTYGLSPQEVSALSPDQLMALRRGHKEKGWERALTKVGEAASLTGLGMVAAPLLGIGGAKGASGSTSGSGVASSVIPRKADGSVDWEKVAAAGAGGYTAYKDNQVENEKLNQMRDQTALQRQTLEDSELGQASSAEHRLNRSPIQDKATALLMSRLGMTPQAFQGRDPTHNVDAVYGQPSGGAAPILSAQAQAAQQYQPGQGGVSTAADEEILNKFLPPQAIARIKTRMY